jgi:hypothetical protein
MEIKASEKQLRDDASEVDRHWFEQNPGYHACVRPTLDRELPGAESGKRNFTVVVQSRPGARVRLPFVIPEGLPLPLPPDYTIPAFIADDREHIEFGPYRIPYPKHVRLPLPVDA